MITTHPIVNTMATAITASAVLEQVVGAHGFTITRTRIAPRAQMETAVQEGMVFVGDAFMPYLGAPFVAEGSPEGLVETIDTLSALRPTRLVHGHPPLTDFYTARAIGPLGAALREIASSRRSTAASMRETKKLATLATRETSSPRATRPSRADRWASATSR